MAWYIRNYEVLSRLGGGRYGEVFLAVGEVPGRGLSAGKRRLVAIKKLRDRSSPEAAGLLMQEFSLLDQVKHRGIVRVFEYMEEGNAVVMEAVHGINLRTILQECTKAHEQVFTEAVVEIACELADALYQANTSPGDNGEPLRLVHRDLKPENIMLTPQGEVKILDFGLARVDNSDFAREDPSRIRGTPIYMAPEQARGEAVDHRTDLFALGLITYELLMNRPAYRVPERSADPVTEVFQAIERGDLGSCVTELESKIPGMGPVIARCLQARPRSRYQNGQELLVDLRRQLYRDRGTYLQEFCEFFFGSIYELEPLPSIESPASSPASSSERRRPMTMEERLRQSINMESAAARARPAAPPSPSPPPPRPPDPGPSASSRARAFAPPSRSPQPPPPPREDAGPPPAKPRKAPKIVGARAPDETGMLEIVPLGREMEQETDDPSATAFFAIPAPKVERAPPPPEPAAAPSPPPAPSHQPAAQGPVASGPVASGPVASGPVASTPFQARTAATAPPPPDADSGRRVDSYRVYAVILVVVFLVATAILAAVWFRPSQDPPGTTAQASSSPQAAPVRAPPPMDEDTGMEPEPPPTPQPPKPRPATTTRVSKPKPAAPSSGPATLTVRITDGSAVSAVEVVCDGSGFRARASVSGGSASVPSVPREACTLHFKGAVPARFSPVRGGQAVSCRLQGTTAVCN